MNRADWNASQSPFEMLVHLRGKGSEAMNRNGWLHCGHSVIHGGPGDFITAEQCRQFIVACGRRYYDLEPIESGNALSVAYLAYSLHDLPKAERVMAIAALQRQPPELRDRSESYFSRWSPDPLGADHAASDFSCAIAYVKAEASMAVTCANATEEEQWYWGWCGPPDPVWHETYVAEHRYQASLLRAIVGNPFAKVRKECDYGDS